MDVADLQPIELFAGLSTDQLSALIEAGEEVPFAHGDQIWDEGGHADHWWVLIDGVVELVRRTEREEMVVGRMDAPGRWAQVEQLELVGVHVGVLRVLQVDPADPVAPLLQERDEVVSDETPRSRDTHSLHCNLPVRVPCSSISRRRGP